MVYHLNKYANQAAYEAGERAYPAVSLVGESLVIYEMTAPIPPAPTENGVYIKYTDGSYSAYDTLVSGKTPVGVALKTDACAFTIHPSEGSDKIWSSNTSTQISGVTTTNIETTAKSDYAGRANTAAVIASGYAGDAFTFATGAVYADGSTGWLPSCGEMEQMRLNATNINTAMALIGGTNVFLNSNSYWSSTQYSFDRAWSYYVGPNYWSGVDKDKSNSMGFKHRARSVTTF